MNINQFKQGDSIVRTERSIINNDGSYIGCELELVNICNSMIYLKRKDSFSIAVFGDKLLDLEACNFSEGWEYYINPLGAFKGKFKSDSSRKTDTLEELEVELKNAVDNEDFELASVIRDLIKELNF